MGPLLAPAELRLWLWLWLRLLPPVLLWRLGLALATLASLAPVVNLERGSGPSSFSRRPRCRRSPHRATCICTGEGASALAKHTLVGQFWQRPAPVLKWPATEVRTLIWTRQGGSPC